MIELGLILAINILGLAFALMLARWLTARDSGGPELRRLAGALERATTAFLLREFRLVLLAVALTALALFSVHALNARSNGLGPAFLATFGLALGAGVGCLVSWFGARLAVQASVRALAAAHKSLDRALSISARAGGAAGLIAETASALGVAMLFAAVYSMKGGFALGEARSAEFALGAAALLPGYALGAGLSGLIVQRGGATYHTASDVAADLAGERDAGLEHDDARNPAVVSDLVGDQVGHAATRTSDLFVSATLTNVAALIIGAGFHAQNPQQTAGALSVVLLPLVIRAFGVIGGGFGVMVVRTEDSLSPAAALWRGQITTCLVSLGGLFGASFWLLGESLFLRFALGGAIGVAACTLVAHGARLRVERRFNVLKDVLESQRAGDATAIAHGLGVGLGSSALPVFIVGAAMAMAFQLGVSSGLVNGGLFGLVVALTALLAGAPYLIALSSLGPIADSARGVLAMTPTAAIGDTELRAGRLDDAGFAASAVAQTYLIVVGALSALLAAAALPLLTGRVGSATGVDLGKPVVLWSGALGAAAVLGYAGSGLRAAARGVRGLFLEVERQLRGFPRERGFPQVPPDFTPSYRACVELSTRLALEKLALPVAAALLAPAALGVGLRLLYLSTDPGLPAEGLTAFVVVASITGLAATLAVEAARATLGAARRASRPRGATPGFAASVSGDAVADLVGSSAGPAAQLLVRAVAVSALAVAPFVT